jgi:heme/copper-type cytochrome/quinol oxidase subunit 3
MLTRTGRIQVSEGLNISIFLGVLFTFFQILEYSMAPFSINDGIYGSIFYVSTGFHGLHVIIGTTALIVCAIRHFYHHFQMEHHLGFEFSL